MIGVTPFCTAVVLSLLTIFFVIIFSVLIKKQTHSLYEKIDDTETVEMAIRDLIRKNPDSEIHLFCNGRNSECMKIVHKLAQDFPQIHISCENLHGDI